VIQRILEKRQTNNVQELNKKIVLITNSQRFYIQKILLKLSDRDPEMQNHLRLYSI
jgi:hypothetical protein